VSRRTFFSLIFAIVIMGAILMLNRQNVNDHQMTPVLPGLESRLNDVTKLTIRTAGNRAVVTLIRGQERWMVAERGNYPADVGKIRQNLIALAKATVVEKKTADPALYTRLGVEDIAKEDATGVEIVIDSPNESYRIIIGKTGVRGDQAYARKPDSAGSLLISAKLSLDTQPANWLDRTVVDIPSNDIFRVTTTHPDGETFSIEKSGPDDTIFKLAGQPADAKPADSGMLNSIGSALAGLKLDDVVTPENADIQDTKPVVTRFETFGGLIIDANVYPNDDKSFVSFKFTSDPELAARFAAKDKDKTAGDTATEKADELNNRLGKWLFILPPYKLGQLTYHLPAESP